MKTASMTAVMIAPCGMNCGICIGHLREENACPGCRLMNATNRKYVKKCRLKLCDKRDGKYCLACIDFPCKKLAALDKRYREKYGMSEIENLLFIKEYGIRKFIEKEQKRWKCRKCGQLMSCHRDECLECGADKDQTLKGSNAQKVKCLRA